MGHAHQADQVDADDGLDLVHGQIGKGPGVKIMADIVDQHVEPAAGLFGDLFSAAGHVLAAGDVAVDGGAGGEAGAAFGVDLGNEHLCATGGEGFRTGPADAGPAPGDKHRPARKVEQVGRPAHDGI